MTTAAQIYTDALPPEVQGLIFHGWSDMLVALAVRRAVKSPESAATV